jgi:hypothetical protein
MSAEAKHTADSPCPYPVIYNRGECCGETPCGITWERECDALGGCLDRSTCGGCEQPVYPTSHLIKRAFELATQPSSKRSNDAIDWCLLKCGAAIRDLLKTAKHWERLGRMAATGTAESFLAVDDATKRDFFAMAVNDSSRRKAAEVTTSELLATLEVIANESVFNRQRFAEDTDTDYFLRCFKAVKDRALAAIAKAEGRST